MINIIHILLQDEEYKLKEFDGKIMLFKGTSTIYPEEYIEVEKTTSTGKFIVSEVHRDVKQIKVKADKKEEAGVYAAIVYKKLYDDIADRIKARNIQNYIYMGEGENQNAVLSRGYVVFYNYCAKLQHISSFYRKIQQKLNFSIGCEKILRLYILGK